MDRLCGTAGCRLPKEHDKPCKPHPKEAWGFMDEIDKNKLDKAGYATPRGGAKGGYQNHVYRNNRVIVPYEHLDKVNLSHFENGYIIRLFPDQVFSAKQKIKKLVLEDGTAIKVGGNAFVLYRSHSHYDELPPLKGWKVRGIVNAKGKVVKSRNQGTLDTGHYIVRLPKLGGSSGTKKKSKHQGPAQGIFAPEYATTELNYLSQVTLAWQIVHASNSPYTSNQAAHLKLILDDINLSDGEHFRYSGMMNGDITSCPLCLKKIEYTELHQTIGLDGEDSLLNAGVQIEGTTRSTQINLFHLHPLVYDVLLHVPEHVSWGHATCNTKLGQRRCFSLKELQEENIKVAKVIGSNTSTFGWISEDDKMIRSPLGAVWIQISTDSKPV